MANNNFSFETGQCYVMFVEYRHDNGDFLEPRQGKSRPVIIFKDPFDEEIFACQTTTQIDKPRYKRNGVLIQDIQEAGLKKDTIIRLEFHSRYKIKDTNSLKGPIGKLSMRDTERFVEKLVQTIQREYRLENSLEL